MSNNIESPFSRKGKGSFSGRRDAEGGVPCNRRGARRKMDFHVHRPYLLSVICSLLFAILLSSCQGTTNNTGGTMITYYAAAKSGSELLEAKKVSCPPGADALSLLIERTLDDLRAEGLGRSLGSLLRYELTDGIVTIYMTAGYAALTGYDRTLADACLVLGLTENDGIEGVIVAIEGEALPAALYADDFLQGSLVVSAAQSGSVRFFSDADRRYAVQELRSLALREGETAERYLLLDLIAGPKNEELLPVLPAGTELRSVVVNGGVCTVDFSREFVENAVGTFEEARMTLCCVTETLCALSYVDAVVIWVEGVLLEDYFGFDCRLPLQSDPFVLTGGSQPLAYDINLFYPDKEGKRLWAVPVTLAAADNEALVRKAVETLCHGAPPLGMGSALPSDARVQSVVTTSYGYSVDFSAGFSRAEPPFSPELALQAVAHVLAQLSPGTSVSFTQDGVPLTAYMEYELLQRVYADMDIVGEVGGRLP